MMPSGRPDSLEPDGRWVRCSVEREGTTPSRSVTLVPQAGPNVAPPAVTSGRAAVTPVPLRSAIGAAVCTTPVREAGPPVTLAPLGVLLSPGTTGVQAAPLRADNAACRAGSARTNAARCSPPRAPDGELVLRGDVDGVEARLRTMGDNTPNLREDVEVDRILRVEGTSTMATPSLS